MKASWAFHVGAMCVVMCVGAASSTFALINAWNRHEACAAPAKPKPAQAVKV